MNSQNPEAYLPDVATTLNNLAVLLKDQRQFAEASAAYQEALGIYQKLYETKGVAYAANYAANLINLGIFYLQVEQERDRDKSIELCKQCIVVGFPIAEQMPMVMQYIQTAVQVLRAWDFDVEGWLGSL